MRSVRIRCFSACRQARHFTDGTICLGGCPTPPILLSAKASTSDPKSGNCQRVKVPYWLGAPEGCYGDIQECKSCERENSKYVNIAIERKHYWGLLRINWHQFQEKQQKTFSGNGIHDPVNVVQRFTSKDHRRERSCDPWRKVLLEALFDCPPVSLQNTKIRVRETSLKGNRNTILRQLGSAVVPILMFRA